MRRVVALDVLAHLGRSRSTEAPGPAFAGDTQAGRTPAAPTNRPLLRSGPRLEPLREL